MMGGEYSNGMMGFGYGGIIMWIIIAVVVGLAIYWFVARGGNFNFPVGKQRNESLDILKNRYARGEINADEYEQMKKELEE